MAVNECDVRIAAVSSGDVALIHKMQRPVIVGRFPVVADAGEIGNQHPPRRATDIAHFIVAVVVEHGQAETETGVEGVTEIRHRLISLRPLANPGD